MKKVLFCLAAFFCAQTVFAQSMSFKVGSYLISRKQTASLYERAELAINDETQSWEVILYRKDGKDPETIRLENFNEVLGNGVFRSVLIQEGGKKITGGYFGYVPVFDDKIQIDICDNRTEAVRRRLVLEF